MWSKIKIAGAQNKNVSIIEGRARGGKNAAATNVTNAHERKKCREQQQQQQQKCVQFTYRASVIRWPCVRLMESGIESISPHMHTIIRPIQMSANPICNDPGTRKILALFVFLKKITVCGNFTSYSFRNVWVVCCCFFLLSSEPINRLCPKKNHHLNKKKDVLRITISIPKSTKQPMADYFFPYLLISITRQFGVSNTWFHHSQYNWRNE